MKKHEAKGLVVILAVALVLGLASSASVAGLSFGVKAGMGFMAPLKAGGDFLDEDFNDMVDDMNQDLEDTKDWVEGIGGTASVNMAEKITRGWNLEGYAQYGITETFGVRGSVGYLTGMTSDFGYDLSYWDDWAWDQMTEKMTVTISASCLFISLEPTFTLPFGNFLVTLGGGPGYYMGKTPFNVRDEYSGDWWGTLVDLTTDGTLSGSGIGFRGFAEGAYSTDGFAVGIELGYRVAGMDTSGEITTQGEVFWTPVDETETVTGKLDFGGLYFLGTVGFAI